MIQKKNKSFYGLVPKINLGGINEMESIFTAIFEMVDGGYIGYVEELPGANTQGKTPKEARENLHEAVELILLSNRELAEKELSGKEFIREEIKVAV